MNGETAAPLERNYNMSYGRDRDRGGYGGSRGGFGGGRPPMGPKPVEVGKEYDVEVTELSRRGDGVAKVQGFVIFVQGAKVGQKVKVKIDRVGPRFASATVVGEATGPTASAAPRESSSSSSPESQTESQESQSAASSSSGTGTEDESS
jgi:predicted RNA-binding protein with TRAM domain